MKGTAALAALSVLGMAPETRSPDKWRMEFRAQLFAEGAAGANIINVGYDPGGIIVGLNEAAVIPSESRAISMATSLVRRFTAVGVDCRAVVYGKPVDDGINTVATPVRALVGAELTEQAYAFLDTVPPGLRERISLANKAPGAGGAALDADFLTDAGLPPVA